ncbi:hypothetical protein SPRG_20808 [Saprolegnia parasitica CBS 223.65]|uniref:Uncharacterized protein n=1 Tax=Saprolegnia parasitica (strain CBS 223.65) TaxID=695850 RepID=A0A067C1X4_SAPPC|nr:hypothetical protein SPRG_20808 [Saprolegnia parasitica CBS 223.65]KDO24759.1 hypothetical protein SPRG_20808 [Saprolegnia parasitica CBS 223.65]|eukprot:XP_012204512.1 hypothetical protein SPRG_20808 [Saprolegnia parasitica CBS 223.65]
MRGSRPSTTWIFGSTSPTLASRRCKFRSATTWVLYCKVSFTSHARSGLHIGVSAWFPSY